MVTKHRVLFIAPRYHTNQVPIVKALMEQGHAVAFAVRWKFSSEDHSLLSPVMLDESSITRALLRLTSKNKQFPFRLWWGSPKLRSLVSVIRDFQPTVVVIRNPITLTGILAVLTTRLVKAVPVLYTQMPKYAHRARRLMSFYDQCVRADWYTPVLGHPSPTAHTLDRLYYVPFVIDPVASAYQKSWFSDNRINIICVAKFEKRKGHLILFEALARLSSRYPLRVTLVGNVLTMEWRIYYQELQARANALGISELIEYRLDVPYSEMSSFYLMSDLYVLPSYNEPASVSVLEAMAHGLPVICSDTNGTQCYIEQGYNGFVFRSHDADDLAHKIESAIVSRDNLRCMGEHSLRLVEYRHRPLHYVHALESLAEGLPVDESIFLTRPPED